MKKNKSTIAICLLVSIILIFSACNSHTPLLEDLNTSVDKFQSVVLTNPDGKSVSIEDVSKLNLLQDYKKSDKLSEEREYEVFDQSNYTLCSITTTTSEEIGLYFFNSGEIICHLGDEIEGFYYIYTTEGQKTDTAFVEQLFKEYRFA